MILNFLNLIWIIANYDSQAWLDFHQLLDDCHQVDFVLNLIEPSLVDFIHGLFLVGNSLKRIHPIRQHFYFIFEVKSNDPQLIQWTVTFQVVKLRLSIFNFVNVLFSLEVQSANKLCLHNSWVYKSADVHEKCENESIVKPAKIRKKVHNSIKGFRMDYDFIRKEELLGI